MLFYFFVQTFQSSFCVFFCCFCFCVCRIYLSIHFIACTNPFGYYLMHSFVCPIPPFGWRCVYVSECVMCKQLPLYIHILLCCHTICPGMKIKTIECVYRKWPKGNLNEEREGKRNITDAEKRGVSVGRDTKYKKIYMNIERVNCYTQGTFVAAYMKNWSEQLVKTHSLRSPFSQCVEKHDLNISALIASHCCCQFILHLDENIANERYHFKSINWSLDFEFIPCEENVEPKESQSI